MPDGFIPPHGGYKRLLSYQKAEIIYDGTVWFCEHHIGRRSRTHDQMVQAARSGKQNIVEGSMASATSKEMEIKLTNVARASLTELLTDCRDFMRVRGHHPWPMDHPAAQRLRELNRSDGFCYETIRAGIEHRDPLVSANVLAGLCMVCIELLRRQVAALEARFLEEGGLRERMTRARLEVREQQRREELEGR